jgi:glucose/mannose transport system substrate-binding protein
LLGSAALLGCADSPDTVRLEVYTWWEEESERRAFEAVIDIHQSRYENVEVVNIGNDVAPEIRQLMASRVLAGAPPTSFQANLGADMLSWTMVETEDDPADLETDDDIVRSRWIRDLSTLFGDTNLDTELRVGPNAGILDGLVVPTDPPTNIPYAVPINIHRLNVLYYNVERFVKVQAALAALDPPQTLLDLETLCTHDFTGTGLEIAVGRGDPAWPLVVLTFESVFPAMFGWEAYDRLFSGERWNSDKNPSEEVRAALTCVQHMSKWFTPNMEGWADAVNEVKEPTRKATFTVMGDWANGLLLDDPDQQVVKGVPFPVWAGVEPAFVYTSDTFPLPIGTEHPSEAQALLETIASPEAQTAFSAQKGSIPARRDASIAPLPASRAETVADFETLPLITATSGLFPPYYPLGALWSALADMTAKDMTPEDETDDEARIEEALRVFTDAEPLLWRWHERMRLGAADPYVPEGEQ